MNKIEYWENEININNFLDTSIKSDSKISNPIKENNNKVLLTGSTGFLGAYILSLLVVKDNIDTIYCLTRNKKKVANLNDSILNNLKHHQLYNNLNEKELSKIKAVGGDLSKEDLGFSEFDYDEITNECNLIIHSGADVNLFSRYEKIKSSNVNGVKEIIKLSISNKRKSPIGIVFVSTYGVFIKQDNMKEFDEQLAGLVKLENIEKARNGYIQSKIVSEYILTQSSNLKSIPYMILRVPSIFSNPDSGIGHEYDLVQHYYKTVYEVKQYPVLQTKMLISPVTWVSKNCVALIFNNHKENGWLKLNQNRNHLNAYNVTGNVVNINNIFNNQYKSVEFEEWKSIISNTKKYFSQKIKNPNNYNPINLLSLESGYSISNKTKQLLQSLGTYENGGIVNFEMLIKNFNRYKLEYKL